MLNRDPKYIQSKLYRKDGKIYTKEQCIIEFPKWYLNKDLAVIEEQSKIYGIFCIIMGNKYSVSTIPTLITTVPILVNEIEKDDTEYVQFVYNIDDPIIDNELSIKHELLSYYFFEGYFMYAKIPWYIEYEDILKVMDNLPKYASSSIGKVWTANELLVSFITRSIKDKTKFYRQIDLKEKYDYIDLMNVFYSVTSPVLKLGGNYFNNALVSAIVQKTDTETKLDKLVRV